MDFETGDFVVGALVAILGGLGLVLGAGAVDDEMYIFGLSLFAFAYLFILGIVRRACDRADRRRAAERRAGAHV